MMNDYDPQLATQLRTMVAYAPVPESPALIPLRRGRQARHRRTMLTIVAGVAALGLTGTGSLATIALDDRPATQLAEPLPGTAPAEQAGRLRLVAAVTATGGASFAMHIGVTGEATSNQLTAEEATMLRELTALPIKLDGAVDPAAHGGYLNPRLPSRFAQQRLVDGQLYIGDGTVWKKPPGHSALTLGSVDGPFAIAADPTQLLGDLRKAGEVSQAEPASGNDIYRFKIEKTVQRQVPGDKKSVTTPWIITGEVWVGQDTQKITKVIYRVPYAQSGVKTTVVAIVTIDISDHGQPVTVQRPTNIVP